MHSLPHVQPKPGNGAQPKTRSSKALPSASQSPDQIELELINLPSNPAKGDANSNDILVEEDPESPGDRDSIISESKDDANQGDDKSNSQVRVADSGHGPVFGDDCLTCSDTEGVAIHLACKKFPKKVQASCGASKQGLWKDAQLEQIGNNCTTMWASDYGAIKTEWDLTQDRDPSSFAVSEMMVCTD